MRLTSKAKEIEVAGKAPSVQGYSTAEFVLASRTMVNLTGLKTTATILSLYLRGLGIFKSKDPK